MAEFNKFNLYSYNCGNINIRQKDEVDKHIEFFDSCNDYAEVKDYILEHFGDINEEKWINFDSCQKECYFKFNDERIEFCSLKNHKQYYGKGWLKLS